MENFNYSKFETELSVRPDDIDMNNHVHFSKYLDYVLAARHDQLKRCYKMSMEDFHAMGYNWVVKNCFIVYKRPLFISDHFIVKTGIESINASSAKVAFEIIKKETRKLCADGNFEFTLISIASGKIQKIPQSIIDHYSF
ncbi:MAG: acyl-CoA thioesterase [Ignavibacteria bacterium]|nr:acyl-CoA thioesterase [Ignavibacteria bacterium]